MMSEAAKQLNSSPTVSVVIPCYNQPKDLHRCLDSLVDQSYKNFEVLVCDDGSEEDMAAVTDCFADRLAIYFLTDTNFGGPARPRNRGIAASRGQYIAFLDADDWWAADKLKQSVAALENGADIVYHDLFVVRSADQCSFNDKISSTPVPNPAFESLLCLGVSIPNSSAVVRKESLIKIGSITEDRDLVSVEDYDTWIRLSRVTERFTRLSDCLGFYWVGGGNISAPSSKQMERIKKLYAQYLDDLEPILQERALGILSYRIGRIGVSCGEFKQARSQLAKALISPIPWSYRAKAIIFLSLSLIKSIRF
ncbi:glycosyltransferase family 2 protein [Cohaesibacter gelatinilyticus]|uniref:Glycosyltransferase involved in cell wall bisynthesis n=1 Tax=Cohaesibacter gelatinilyticus TaxID=372072 RepID=A0A285PEL2_9HYPH|nr:glycosyltransferase family 2 protein [Cohaesibacter gelatinilyticus]SNZ20155.1 Glycosyltransferase involved in cell wall bisynthesis [Cohaesibacter gelatinilyticus]